MQKEQWQEAPFFAIVGAMGFLDNLFKGDPFRNAEALRPIVDAINKKEEWAQKIGIKGLSTEVNKLKQRAKNGENLNELLPEMFALTREAGRHTLGQRHYDVQMIGGIALHQGNIAEMRTGEGKTLSATLAVALNAITEKGVHVVTVNDYLARRDMVWMGQIYDALGLSVACITHDGSFLYDATYKKAEESDEIRDEIGSFKVVEEFLRPCSRQEAYNADITYGTNNEFGFDFLRDNLEITPQALRQRAPYFAIVDEVDSILIDEARTPLIISAPDQESEDLYKVFSSLVPKLKREEDYDVDEKLKAVTLTEEGIEHVERLLGIKDIYTEKGVRYVRHLEQALRANILFRRDKEYVVKNNEVIIVDEFTGRIMPGRRWSDGLHQAVEAKEGVKVQKESRTIASITFQNYFKMYEKLSGMTGTGMSSEEEFQQVYGLEVIPVPTNKPAIRVDLPDAVFQTDEGKYRALAKTIKEQQDLGRPVLIGTVSIEKNEKLSELLKRNGVKHELLNAKNHEREGEIIAQAGKAGAVTVATNMAGRGVDIILGGAPFNKDEAEKVRESGGLFVVGTERHEARRIDDQLRGRAGRQGDQGTTQFFVSLEDDLMRVFGGERVKKMMGTFGVPEDEPLASKLVSKSIESAQEKIEGFHFDARKHVLDYDNVLSKQRTAVYTDRKKLLLADNDTAEEHVDMLVEEYIHNIVEEHTEGVIDNWRRKELAELFRALTGRDITNDIIALTEQKEIEDRLHKEVEQLLHEERARGSAFAIEAKTLYIQVIDHLWQDHLEAMEYTRNSVRLRAYGQHDPLVEYKNEAINLFRTFNAHVRDLFVRNIFKWGHRAKGDVGTLAPPHPVVQAAARAVVNASTGEKMGRNDPCPCGSGKKYKKCGLINAPEHK